VEGHRQQVAPHGVVVGGGRGALALLELPVLEQPLAAIFFTGSYALNALDYIDGTGAVDVGNGSHATDFTGVLYAPGSDVTVNGGLAVRGSLTVNSLRVNGAPNFILAYDLGLQAVIDQNWRVERWREVPSGSLGF